jgi:hypothetical protein
MFKNAPKPKPKRIIGETAEEDKSLEENKKRKI